MPGLVPGIPFSEAVPALARWPGQAGHDVRRSRGQRPIALSLHQPHLLQYRAAKKPVRIGEGLQHFEVVVAFAD
jgi:hypothetical protein